MTPSPETGSFPGALILPWKGVWPKMAPGVFVAPGAVIIGDVDIGPESSVWFGCVLRGDVNTIRIGARTNIQDGTVIHVASNGSGTVVGDDVTIGHRALLHACTVGSACLVGMGATVLDNAVVEGGSMVAAGAVVSPGKRVLEGTLWAGCPATQKRALSAQEQQGFLDSARAYVALAQGYANTGDRAVTNG